MLEVGLAQLVSQAATVQGLIGNPARHYPVVLPENPVFPCSSYQVLSMTPEYLLNAAKPTLSQARIQVDTWSGGPTSGTYVAAKQVQAAIRKVLELFTGALPDGTLVAAIFVANAVDLYEQDARCYRTSTDYIVNYYPA